MAFRIRTTEQHPHPIWEKLITSYKIVEIEGLIFECSFDGLITATKESRNNIPLHCIEAIEFDTTEEVNFLNVYTQDEWLNKILVAGFFGGLLKIVCHVVDSECRFTVYEVEFDSHQINFNEVQKLHTDTDFINWWKSHKKLQQSKGQVEAAPRQAKTVFDGVLTQYGLQWGGNIDGFVLQNEHKQVIAIIELRQSRTFPVEKYDPSRYFLGTNTKGGDFNTWLPLIYLKKGYNLPLVLITVSTLNPDKLGYTEVLGINNKKLFYVDNISPIQNVTNDFENFMKWFEKLIIEKVV